MLQDIIYSDDMLLTSEDISRIYMDPFDGMPNFSGGTLLGKGSYANVYKYKEGLVIKLMNCADEFDAPFDIIKAETYIHRILTSLRLSPKIHKVAKIGDVSVVIMDQIPDDYVSVKTILDSDTDDNIKQAALNSLINVIQLMHSYGIQHGDLNPDNFFYSKERYRTLVIDVCCPITNRPKEFDWISALKYSAYPSTFRTLLISKIQNGLTAANPDPVLVEFMDELHKSNISHTLEEKLGKYYTYYVLDKFEQYPVFAEYAYFPPFIDRFVANTKRGMNIGRLTKLISESIHFQNTIM